MKKIIISLVSLCLILMLSGCSDNEINRLIEEKKYQEAYELAEEKNNTEMMDVCKYHLAEKCINQEDYAKAFEYLDGNNNSDAVKLLEKNKGKFNSVFAIESTLKELNEIHNLIKESKVGAFEFTKSQETFYIQTSKKLTELKKKILKENLSDLEDEIISVFGMMPKSTSEANKWITELEGYFKSEKDIYHLSYVMGAFNDNENIVISSFDDEGIIVLEHVNEYLHQNHFSYRTFAVLLGILDMYGAEIEQNGDKLIISCPKVTRVYDFCIPSDNEKKFENWFDKNKKSIKFEVEEFYPDQNLAECTFIIDSDFQTRFKFFAVNFVIDYNNGEHIQHFYKRLEEVEGKDEIRIPFNINNVREGEYTLSYDYNLIGFIY